MVDGTAVRLVDLSQLMKCRNLAKGPHNRDIELPLRVKPSQERSEEMRVRRALGAIIQDQSVDEWLQQPNQAFDGSTPLQVIERGETDRLWRMIWHLREGDPG